ncbi:MAG: ATPase, T2SS/T4P/T4SS family [Microbacteriaceae bacterium]|nr:ATPase, T2SS/T4P/T4SS family [Microbacteriaceae bacterium]
MTNKITLDRKPRLPANKSVNEYDIADLLPQIYSSPGSGPDGWPETQKESVATNVSATLPLAAQRACGWLLPVLDTPGLGDLLVQVREGRVETWADYGAGELQQIDTPDITPEQLREQAVALLAAGGRQLDELHPCQDAHLGRGVRVHAALAPVAVHGTALSIRVPAVRFPGFDDLVAAGLCDRSTAEVLRQAIDQRYNLLVTGGTGAGKTTLLRALLELVPGTQRIITIEDVAELRLQHPHHVALEVRNANSESAGAVSLDELLRQSLRMRPDRLVLGECRGVEIATLLTALNTGHNGGAGTLHASTVRDVAARVEALGALAGLSERAIAKQFTAAVHLVVQLERVSGVHKITALGVPHLNALGTLEVVAVSAEQILRQSELKNIALLAETDQDITEENINAAVMQEKSGQARAETTRAKITKTLQQIEHGQEPDNANLNADSKRILTMRVRPYSELIRQHEMEM